MEVSGEACELDEHLPVSAQCLLECQSIKPWWGARTNGEPNHCATTWGLHKMNACNKYSGTSFIGKDGVLERRKASVDKWTLQMDHAERPSVWGAQDVPGSGGPKSEPGPGFPWHVPAVSSTIKGRWCAEDMEYAQQSQGGFPHSLQGPPPPSGPWAQGPLSSPLGSRRTSCL